MHYRRRTSATGKLEFVLLFLVGMTVAGCRIGPVPTVGPPPTVAIQSPADTAYAYFKAMNDGDFALAAAHLEGGWARWLQDDPPPRGEFENLQCGPSDFRGEDTATTASAVCDFTIREDWSGFSATNYGWGVYMRRQSTGPWLIYDQGQG